MCTFANRKVSSMKQSVRRIIHKYSLYSTKWQKYPKHGQWYDNMNKRYIKTNYRKSEKLFYFEDALNKSICLWKQKYYATENENLRRVLWLEYLRIEDRVYYDIVNKDRYNEWDGYIPWAMYCVVGTDEYKDMDSIDIGKIIVGEIEEQFRRNFGPGNCGKEFEKEYLGFREKKLAYVTLDEYMKHFGMSFMP